MIASSWIDGTAVFTGGDRHQVINPADGTVVAELALAQPADVDAAVASARSALPGWSSATPAERSTVLATLAGLLESHTADVVAEEVSQTGKPVRLATEFDVPGSVDNIAFFAGAARHLEGKATAEYSADHTSSIRREAVGVVATITPWNYPLQMAVWKVIPALAAGCSVVIKPAELTPLTTLTLARLAKEAGLPDGVLNVITGAGADVGQALAGHPGVDVVTFTGSTPVGKMLAAKAAAQMKRATMELGGHAPVIVCNDADIDLALKTLVPFKFRNAGQVCISPTRFYVQEGVYDRFVAGFVQKAQTLKVGDGLAEGTQMGPLAQQRRVGAVAGFIEDARERGASVLLGGAPMPGAGNFFAPTVIADLPDNARLLNEEPFGPVAGMVRFKSVDEVLQRANSLPYGLASYVFTTSNRNAHVLSTGLAAGMVSINHLGLALAETPFGGINDSGMGSEGGTETFDGYLNTKFVSQLN